MTGKLTEYIEKHDGLRRTRDLILSDILVMKGGGSSAVFVMVTLIFLVGGFVISPICGCLCPMLGGFIFVSTLTQNEIKSRGEKMYCLLPIDRRELVRARFVSTAAFTAAITLVFYLLMLLSLKIRVYDILVEDGDFLAMFAERSNGALTELSLLNMYFSAGFWLGIISALGMLRGYFKDSRAFGNEMFETGERKMSLRDKMLIALMVLLPLTFAVLFGAGKLNGFLTAFSLVLQLVKMLAQAANGVILSALFISGAVFKAIHIYVSTVIDYEDTELR